MIGLLHERLLVALGLGTTIALTFRTWSAAALVLAATVVFAAAAALSAVRAPRLRLALAYAYTLWLYEAVAWITPALGSPLRDPELAALDRALFGELPAVALGGWATPALTDVLSLCYLSYHLYLHLALLWALRRAPGDVRLYERLFTAFALGLFGYLLVPAVGPAVASPEVFAGPLGGGWATALNHAIISRGTSVYDVFPSLHVLITLTLLDHDRRHHARRFGLLLPVCAGLFVSTVYLRYHYAVDLLAAVGFFIAARLLHHRFGRASGPAA